MVYVGAAQLANYPALFALIDVATVVEQVVGEGGGDAEGAAQMVVDGSGKQAIQSFEGGVGTVVELQYQYYLAIT